VTDLIVDLFAGAGGWDEGMLALDLDANVVGIEWDEWACRTGKAAGHARVRADVSVLHPAFFPMTGLIASPPCTKFSAAGSGVGRKVISVLVRAVRSLLNGEDVRAEVIDAIYPMCLRDRQAANNKRAEEKRSTPEQVERSAREDAACTALVLEPARWINSGNPEWVAFEQVPDVLPIWREYVRVLKEMGWSA
jgi:DNA (cytosine-5)-methyltransferase 1